MAMNVTPFVGTDNFNMETFNNMISQINNGVNSEISEVLAQLGTKAKIQTGSYVGTGTYGADNPCSLTFDFEPLFICISPTNPLISNTAVYGLWQMNGFKGQSQIYYYFSTSGTIVTTERTQIFWEKDRFIWYEGMNDSNVTYQYLAIGI